MKEDALYKFYILIEAMKEMQQDGGEFAKVNCSLVEKWVKEIKEIVEKI